MTRLYAEMEKRMEVSPLSTSLPAGSYRLILSKFQAAIVNRRGYYTP